jgi:hypothetical protein
MPKVNMSKRHVQQMLWEPFDSLKEVHGGEAIQPSVPVKGRLPEYLQGHVLRRDQEPMSKTLARQVLL